MRDLLFFLTAMIVFAGLLMLDIGNPERCKQLCQPHPVETFSPLRCDCLTPNEWDSSGPRPTGHSKGAP